MTDFLFSAFGFILALGILVTVHEFGHFWVARSLGVKVLRFSVGFGRPLWSKRGRVDDTEYVVAAIPLGGYVKMLDENEEESDIPAAEVHRAFNRQSLWKRIAIVLAGPMFNFLFAALAYWVVFVGGVEGIRPIVGNVVENSIAASGGFQKGDEIITIDGRENRSWGEHRLYMFNQAFSRRNIPVEVLDLQGRFHQRNIDLSKLALNQIDSGLMENGIGLYGYYPEIPPIIGDIVAGEPAQLAGLQSGDRIRAVGAERIDSWRALVESVRPRAGQPTEFTVDRDGGGLTFIVVPQRVEVDGQIYGRIGIRPAPVELPEGMRVEVSYGLGEAAVRSVESVWVMSSLTLKMLWKILWLEVSPKNISGPLTIAQYAGDSVQIGVDRFLLFLAVVSISLGVINLLPIPILDGGHLLYYLMEAITGGPVSKQVMLWGQQVGILLLFGLMSLAFYNDIVRLLQ